MKRRNLIFLMLFIAIGLIAGLILFYYVALFKKEPILGLEVRQLLHKEQPLKRQAILSLTSNKKEYLVNEGIIIDIYLDSQGNLVDGVDAVLRYDPQFLQLQDKKSFLDTYGSVFSSFPGIQIDEAVGEIKISAITSPGRSFQGKGKVGSLFFIARKEGQTLVTFVLKRGSTTDSNVSSYAYPGDILSQAENLVLKISPIPL